MITKEQLNFVEHPILEGAYDRAEVKLGNKYEVSILKSKQAKTPLYELGIIDKRKRGAPIEIVPANTLNEVLAIIRDFEERE